MRTVILALALALFMMVPVYSQKLIIELSNAPYSSTHTIFKGKNVENRSYIKWRSQPAYMIGVSGKLAKDIYLKTELGYHTIYSKLSADFQDNQGNTLTISNEYLAHLLSLAVLCELRSGYKSFFAFLNGGFASYATVSGAFSSSGITADINPNDFNGTNFGIQQNGGVGFKKNCVGLFAGYRFSYIHPHKKSDAVPGLGYLQAGFCFGISYDIQ